jgi:hypothetical protein
MFNKMFIGFVASVIMAEISRVMVERALFRSYTMPVRFAAILLFDLAPAVSARRVAPKQSGRNII